MERCDFSSVFRIIINYLNEGKGMSQVDLLYDLFESFTESTGFTFDYGLTSRWINGYSAVSPKLIQYYTTEDGTEHLISDLTNKVFPNIIDVEMLSRDIYDLVMNDISISDSKKAELASSYISSDKTSIADFISAVLIFSLSRKFVARDTKLATVSGTASPVLSDTILCGEAPAPCKHFTGRDNEIEALHEILQENYKVFISGVAGIGKSEFVKAYIKNYKKLYTNVLYFYYDSNLKNLITDIDFVDDRTDDTDDTRFKKHNRYLRSLKEDTLIVIDNFNTTAADEELLDVVMKYKCRVIFTTRSNFDCGYTYQLNELSSDGLVEMFGKLYSDTDKNHDTVINIIEAVNRHTLSVELAARLLDKGLLAPDDVLEKLNECSVDPETSDRINIHKDGKGVKATFYEHIRTLFSICSLSDNMKAIMMCMVFIPAEGINARAFCKWLELPDMNNINDLVELGFVQKIDDKIRLHEIIKDITLADLKPKMTDCKTLLLSLMNICIAHGDEVFRYDLLFQTICGIIDSMIKDAPADYLFFLENAFAYMEKYNYGFGMKKIISEMSALLRDTTLGAVNDRALLLNDQASYERSINGNSKAALPLLKDALEICVPNDNIALYANINMNLGCTYLDLHDMTNAERYMLTAIEITKQVNIVSHDFIIMVHNYATFLANNKNYEKAIVMLKQCADFVRAYIGDISLDYADPIYEAAEIFLLLGDEANAQIYFDEAFRVYSSVLGESDLIKRKATAAKSLKAYQNKKQKRLSGKK